MSFVPRVRYVVPLSSLAPADHIAVLYIAVYIANSNVVVNINITQFIFTPSSIVSSIVAFNSPPHFTSQLLPNSLHLIHNLIPTGIATDLHIISLKP
ncbi:unnamed protein product [Heligmosomoides polygyrus]|uniref:7TM_GPCR_Srx domain-containing protein n=1 Tax=Heligmosomoides polygyrus TaxID=6339 RepID=A0A183FX06_HELPZ|nr:unnamed protein product [Heligmosomoides polygyrus]